MVKTLMHRNGYIASHASRSSVAEATTSPAGYGCQKCLTLALIVRKQPDKSRMRNIPPDDWLRLCIGHWGRLMQSVNCDWNLYQEKNRAQKDILGVIEASEVLSLFISLGMVVF